MADLLIRNIGQLATPEGKESQKGKDQNEVRLLENTAVAVENGVISYVGEETGAPKAKQVIDAQGGLVTPGLVDCHTHLVFGGWRQHELALKLDGVSYIDILKNGGGILSTVRSTRAASHEELLQKGQEALDEMLSLGTTSVEAKSGYGLTTKDELKQLEVIKALSEISPMDIVPTFLGAHALPEEYKADREAFIRLVCEEMIPAVCDKKLAEYCDIFCETAVFTAEESRKVLEAARAHGLGLKIHADEIECIGGSTLAGELKAASAEHLIQIDEQGMRSMKEGGTVAVVLPATSFYLDKPYAPARKMLEMGLAVACASDFNPGSSPSLNLQLTMNLACLKYRLTPKEALTAATLNAAAAIGRAERIGSIETGKQADLLIWRAPDLNYIFYRYGSNLVKTVVKKGAVVVEN